MSHVATIELTITSLESLLAAAQSCGLEVRQKTSYKWYGTSVGDYPIPEGFTAESLGKCDFALGVRGNSSAYEIGVVKRNGTYTLLYDFWGVHGRALQAKIGVNGVNLKKEYVKVESISKLKKEGYTFQSENTVNGKTVIKLKKY